MGTNGNGKNGRVQIGLRVFPEVRDILHRVAAESGVSPAAAMTVLIADAYQRVLSGDLIVAEHLQASGGGRYPWTAKPPTNGVG